MGNGKATLLLQCHLSQIHTQRGVMVIDGVDAHSNVAEVYMVIVQTVNAGLVILVVLHCTMHPINATHRIGLGTQVDECLPRNETAEMGIDAHRVSWHMEHHIRAVDSYAIDIYLPQHRFTGGSIFWYGVGHLDVKESIFQTRAVELYRSLIEIDALAGHKQS